MTTNFDLPEEATMMREAVRDFAEKEIKPVAAELDEKEDYSAELIKKIGDLGLEAGAVGGAGAKTKILKMTSPPQREAAKMLEGETAEETAPKLAKLLREEAKVI